MGSEESALAVTVGDRTDVVDHEPVHDVLVVAAMFAVLAPDEGVLEISKVVVLLALVDDASPLLVDLDVGVVDTNGEQTDIAVGQRFKTLRTVEQQGLLETTLHPVLQSILRVARYART